MKVLPGGVVSIPTGVNNRCGVLIITMNDSFHPPPPPPPPRHHHHHRHHHHRHRHHHHHYHHPSFSDSFTPIPANSFARYLYT